MTTAIAPTLGPSAQASAWQGQGVASLCLGGVTCAAIAIVLVSPNPWPVAVLLLFAPLAEESAFRAGMQEWMLRRGIHQWTASLATAVAFCALHCSSRGISLLSVAVIFPGLFVGWVYARHRCLRLCVALHMLMNILWLGSSQLALPVARTL